MTIPSPIILLPTNGVDYSTDTEVQTLSGTTSSNTGEILVNGSTFGVSYTSGDTIWSWSGTLNLGINTYSILAKEQITNILSNPIIINISLIQSNSFVTVSAPTGIRVREYQDKIEIINSQNFELNIIGYNYYVSTQSGGINNIYVKINTQMITIDEYSFQEEKTKILNKVTDTAGNIRVTTITEEVNNIKYYSVFFDETILNTMINNGYLPSVTWSQDTPFYFVITAVIYDNILGEVSESAYSSELQGSPIIIVSGLQSLPNRSQSDIFLTVSKELLAANSEIDVKPGTVVRDNIDPITEEMARLYIIQNFLSTSLSLSALLNFDDVNNTGISDPVSTSSNKRLLQLALNLNVASDVQNLIDSQFDKLASNVNITRNLATYATGTVVFYIETEPARTMVVNEGAIITSPGNLDQGISSQNYSVLVSQTLDYNTRQQFYNYSTQRYELTCDVQALSVGSIGNADSYAVSVIASGVDSNFKVENPNPIMFGQDMENNHDLATRVELAYFVDTGTGGGYLKTAINVNGVKSAHVEKAMDPLMIRDYDTIRQKHIGGKVDVYIQGEKMKQVTDNVAFAYQSISENSGTLSGETFLVLSATTFQFKSTNSRVTAHTPIFQITRVNNATRGADYDITNIQIIGGNIIKLDETLYTNILIGLASNDVIKVDYKFRSSDTFILNYQPIGSIISIVGQLSGVLSSDNWDLVKLQDPLDSGNSTIAQDSVRIKFANNLPLTDFQTISNENHVIQLNIPENLKFIGADPNTILVTNSDSSINYVENIDYNIVVGTNTVPTAIEMIETGSMINGQIILISYNAIENFAITYTTNGLLDDVQTEVDLMKHACADVIVKGAIENSVDFVITVVPKTAVNNQPNMTAQIRTVVANYIAQLGMGNNLTQSIIINIIQQVNNVAYLVVPFLRMVKADGSFISRDNIGITQFEIFNEGTVTSYITTVSVLEYNTVDQGGPSDLFKGIFENSEPLVLQNDELSVSNSPGNGYIRADGKLVVSTIDGGLPDSKNYQASYYVYGETGSKDINVSSLEYLTVGNFIVQYDTPIN